MTTSKILCISVCWVKKKMPMPFFKTSLTSRISSAVVVVQGGAFFTDDNTNVNILQFSQETMKLVLMSQANSNICTLW